VDDVDAVVTGVGLSTRAPDAWLCTGDTGPQLAASAANIQANTTKRRNDMMLHALNGLQLLAVTVDRKGRRPAAKIEPTLLSA